MIDAEHLSNIYTILAESEAGQHHIAKLKEEANETRKAAAKLEPITAWGRLQFADGLERAIEQIAQMQLLTVGKRKFKQPPSVRTDVQGLK